MPRGGEIVTFVGEGQAKVGFKFIASQPPEICMKCKLFKACMSRLVPGMTYQVMEVKDKEHYCDLYEDKVIVAKVIQASVEMLVKPQRAVEGAIVELDVEECVKKCPLEKVCRAEWSKGGEKIKIKIEKVMEDVSDQAVCRKKFRKVTALVVEPFS